jgi:hypothetical protein
MLAAVATFVTNNDTSNFDEGILPETVVQPGMKWSSGIISSGTALDSDSDSTSTELCDESDRLSDIDSEEQKSTNDFFDIMRTSTEDERSPILNNEVSIIKKKQNLRSR